MKRDILPRLSTAQLQKHLIKWDQIGNKWAGTPGETQTKDYLYEEIKSYGIETRIEEFPYLKYSNPQAKVEIISPIQKELNCLPVSYYANAEVEGEALFVGAGSPQELETMKNAGADFAGKILIAIHDAPFMITPQIQSLGAKALLTVSLTQEPGLIRHCCGAFYGTTAVPSLPKDPFDFITQITGAMIPIDPDANLLLSLLSLGKVRLKIANEATYEQATSWNVIAEIKGQEKPEEKVILGGHYDTEFNVPGVMDNGTGCAGILEIARAVKAADIKLPRSLVFAFFGCEENGLWGSADYVARRKDEMKANCVAFFNLDAIASNTNFWHALWVSDDIKDFMVEAAEAVHWRVDLITGVEVTFSDYAPFRDLNVPNCWAFTYPPDPPYYHTEKDNLTYAPPLRDVIHAAELYALAALDLAGSDKRL